MIRQRLPDDAAGALLAGALALLLALAPLPFGGVTRTASLALALAGFALAALAVATAPSLAPLRLVRVPALALVALAALGLLQALPWPAGVATALSPAHLRAAAESGALVGGEAPARLALSLDPAATRRVALWLLALAGLLVTAALAGESRARRRWLLWGLLAGAVFQVIFGAQHWFARAGEIWGIPVPGDAGRLRGTYVNSDHLALYLELALAACFAWAYRTLRRLDREQALEARLARLAGPLFAWLLLFAGLAFTGSRAGIAAAVGATALQGALLLRRVPGRRWLPLTALALVGMGLAFAAAIGFEQAFGRILGTSGYELTWNARSEAYVAAFGLVPDYLWLGAGLGAFREAFAPVQPPEIELVWRHLHNDWLELLLTAGVLGLAAAIAGLLALVRRLAAVLRTGHRGEDRGAALAALGALAAVGLHSLLDFGLTMPANAAALAVVVGAACAARAEDR